MIERSVSIPAFCSCPALLRFCNRTYNMYHIKHLRMTLWWSKDIVSHYLHLKILFERNLAEDAIDYTDYCFFFLMDIDWSVLFKDKGEEIGEINISSHILDLWLNTIPTFEYLCLVLWQQCLVCSECVNVLHVSDLLLVGRVRAWQDFKISVSYMCKHNWASTYFMLYLLPGKTTELWFTFLRIRTRNCVANKSFVFVSLLCIDCFSGRETVISSKMKN